MKKSARTSKPTIRAAEPASTGNISPASIASLMTDTITSWLGSSPSK